VRRLLWSAVLAFPAPTPPHKGEGLNPQHYSGKIATLRLVYRRRVKTRARHPSPSPLWGGVGEGYFPSLPEAKFMPHSNIDPKTRTRAQSLRRERTKAEQVMWNLLRDLRPFGARFRRETPLGPYIADFAWLSARIIIEVDGHSHGHDDAIRHDARRDAFIRSQGFTVLRFDNDDVLNAEEAVYLEIVTALRHRLIGWDGD
jgi:very-short-patch-repair endonuclease